MTTNIIAICNQKGGVGKTTLTINLGAAFADMGHRVLLIDLDPQGHMTEGVGLREAYEDKSRSLFRKLIKDEGETAALVLKPAAEGFSVIPINYEMMLAEQALFMARNREYKLKNMLTPISSQYDWILIDCPPTLGNLTDNAINAACKVIVPVQAESTSIRALELIFDQIETLEGELKIVVEKLAVVPNLVQASALSHRTLKEMRDILGAVVTPFELRKRVVLQNAWDEGHSIFAYDAKSPDHIRSKQEVVNDYLDLARFVIERVGETTK